MRGAPDAPASPACACDRPLEASGEWTASAFRSRSSAELRLTMIAAAIAFPPRDVRKNIPIHLQHALSPRLRMRKRCGSEERRSLRHTDRQGQARPHCLTVLTWRISNDPAFSAEHAFRLWELERRAERGDALACDPLAA